MRISSRRLRRYYRSDHLTRSVEAGKQSGGLYLEMRACNDAANLAMGPANDAANLEMGLANDAARLRTTSVRQDQRKCLRTASVRQDQRKCLLLRSQQARKVVCGVGDRNKEGAR